MTYLDTNKLRHLVADGHNLARETVLDLLTRIEHQQDRELRRLALDKHPIDPEVKKAKYEAWQTGFESGWAEAKDPGAFVNDVWDAKTPNPYADEEPTNGR